MALLVEMLVEGKLDRPGRIVRDEGDGTGAGFGDTMAEVVGVLGGVLVVDKKRLSSRWRTGIRTALRRNTKIIRQAARISADIVSARNYQASLTTLSADFAAG